ncbi:MAG: tripartite tricarboxylate transporter substrate binding protein [Betaproteobacteria bacterium]|nr:tripartite tricarboxylate transporter substrate binding protein [Betaproteobacteria bacterium]
MFEKRGWQGRSFLALCAFAVLCNAALAQTYPARPIKLIVPLPAGGPPDRTARLLASRLAETLKQPVVVENKAGAGSLLGADSVAKAPPDGYTLLITNQASISLGPLMRRTPYEPLKDFTHIAMIGTFPMFWMVRADHPAKSFQEFLSLAKAKPGSLSYGSSGVGSLGNLLGDLLNKNAGVNIVHVAYKGATPAISDLLGGHIDATYIADSSAPEFVRSGKMRMLATTTEKRVAAFPDVPAMSEIAPGVAGSLWYGISAPARMPQGILERLQAEVLGAVNSAEIHAGLIGIGMTPVPMGSNEFVGFLQSEMRKWEPLIKAANIKVD